ncbi:MAG: phytoene desaturase family protein, partial [Bradymonadaceae bacterium]
METPEVAVVGAGFGGLAAALTLCEQGRDVVVYERLTYPGGCASTFERRGWRFESGATLFAGLADDQLFGRWIDRHDLPVEVDWIDPVVEMRTDRFELAISRDRDEFARRFGELPGVDSDRAASWFDRQGRIADALWKLFRSPDLLPPFGLREFATHLRSAPQYLPLVPLVGRSLADLFAGYDLDEGPARDYFDAVCQITVQTAAADAEAPFAIGATDYFFQGTGHVRGGIGELARSLADAVEEMGGRVSFADPVQALVRADDHWQVDTRRGRCRAGAVVANVLPASLGELVDDPTQLSGLESLDDDVRSGWGAAMLYLGLDDHAGLPARPHHLQLIDDGDEQFVEGNHVFCSISGSEETDRTPVDDARTATCSTHVDMHELVGTSDREQAAYVERVQQRMRRTLRRRAPRVAEAVIEEMTASPRT